MSEVHRRTREFLASLADRDVPALVHLLACDDCTLNALESLAQEVEAPPRRIEPAMDYGEVFQRLERWYPGVLKALEEKRAQAESLLGVLLDVPPGERLTAVERQERFQECSLAEALIERALEAQPREPRRSEELARLAYAAARRSARKTTVEHAASLKVRSCCLLGNALRLLGDLAEADRSFDRAARHLGGPLDVPERTLFNEMVAHLRLAQGRTDEALALLWRAGYLCGVEGDCHRQGVCLAWVGLVYLDHDGLEKALEMLTQARVLLEQEEEPALACRVRLGLALCHASFGRTRSASRYVEEARRLYPRAREHETLVRFYWAEGKVAMRAGRAQEGLELFLSARRQLISLGRLHDAALVTLDAALAMAQGGQAGDIRPLIHEMTERFPDHPAAGGVLLALSAFEALAREGMVDLKAGRSVAAGYIRRLSRGGDQLSEI